MPFGVTNGRRMSKRTVRRCLRWWPLYCARVATRRIERARNPRAAVGRGFFLRGRDFSLADLAVARPPAHRAGGGGSRDRRRRIEASRLPGGAAVFHRRSACHHRALSRRRTPAGELPRRGSILFCRAVSSGAVSLPDHIQVGLAGSDSAGGVAGRPASGHGVGEDAVASESVSPRHVALSYRHRGGSDGLGDVPLHRGRETNRTYSYALSRSILHTIFRINFLVRLPADRAHRD